MAGVRRVYDQYGTNETNPTHHVGQMSKSMSEKDQVSRKQDKGKVKRLLSGVEAMIHLFLSLAIEMGNTSKTILP